MSLASVPIEPDSHSEKRPALEIRGLTFGFPGRKPLFEDLNLTIAEGEFVSLVAASGAGKTTLFRLLAGLLQPQAGTIAFGGETVSGGSISGKAAEGKARIGYMPQRDSLMPWRTVLDNAALGLELQGVSKRDARRQALALLPELGLAGTENQYPHELSGGMRQRVSFLRSLLGGADLLLLDEPFSALDAMTRTSMQQWLIQIWEKRRKTVLFITHDMDEALLLSDRVLVAGASPVSVMEPIEIRLPRPRSYETLVDERFAASKRQIMTALGRLDAGLAGGER
ncbi:ABC transporter ATP-binding protein [Paenibacillus sp. NPDC058071]|uniref:ABC transporter ATP-binding protein n=1 Tax=Paenibacillus sp. NPDC058071 TaxID=3346326 RepID=UPI0036DB1351